MKRALALTFLMLTAGIAAAQVNTGASRPDSAEQLRKAIVEEEANRNLEKAIQAYDAILARYEGERKIAATALFHLAECYRKQGNRDQAVAAYQRVVRDFSEDTKLADASRGYLSSVYKVAASREASVVEARKLRDLQTTYLKLIEEEIKLVENSIEAAQKRVEIGLISAMGPEMTTLKKELIELKLRLADVQAGRFPEPVRK